MSDPDPTPIRHTAGRRRPGKPLRLLLGAGVLTALVVAVLIGEVQRTSATRGAVRTYTALIVAANARDVDAARALCTARYLRANTLAPADEGGLVGLPRNIHPNFQVWREGPNVWLCPTNRVGPVYQFAFERGGWKFDGPVGLLMPGGRVEPILAEP